MCKISPGVEYTVAWKCEGSQGNKLTDQLRDQRMKMMPAKHDFPTPAKSFS